MPVQVVLAGHNLDRDLLMEIRRILSDLSSARSAEELAELRERAARILGADNWTPETLAAAYARVSRDSRSVTELRALARAEVDRARRSNESIIFGLGHSSVAEHAVFNLDILGLSRLAAEVLESQRLVSYTEKSQRYILLGEDWVLPKEIQGTPVASLFRETLSAQHRFYTEAYERLLPLLRQRAGGSADAKADRRALEGAAREDARYALSLATTLQLGETINARNLERLIARCRAHPLAELRELAEELYKAAGCLAPSLIRYTDPTPYMREGRTDLIRAVRALQEEEGMSDGGGARDDEPGTAGEAPDSAGLVRLQSTTPNPDRALVAALLFSGGLGPLDLCLSRCDAMEAEDRLAVVLSHLRHLGPHDSMLREYEQVDLVYDLVVSASCFAQLKRHRMATLIPLEYDPALGGTIPEALPEAGLAESFREVLERSEECSRRVAKVAPAAGAYPLTNAHRRRVLLKLNARELVHLSRLREDAHAQWDIRRVATRMVALAREQMPLTLLLAAGKDRFEERRREIFP